VITLTLGTSAVLHGVQRQAFAEHVDSLVDLARAGVTGIWMTSAFGDDQMRASEPHRRANLEWLAERPCIGEVPGPFRLGYSPLGGKDVLAGERTAGMITRLERIVLPPSLWPGTADRQPKHPRSGGRGSSTYSTWSRTSWRDMTCSSPRIRTTSSRRGTGCSRKMAFA
jgi:hypothetical protein